MSANLVPTDETLCHYGAGKGYIPGISVMTDDFTDSIAPPTASIGNVVTLTNSAPLIDNTDATVVGSNKRFRSLEVIANSTGFPVNNTFSGTRLIVDQGVACNSNFSTNSGQTGTNRNYVILSSSSTGGAQPVDLILASNFLKLASFNDSYIGSSTSQEHVLVATNPSRNNINALGVRGPILLAPTTSVQGDPYLRITPSIPISGSTPVGTVREIQLNDPLQAGPFALPLSYLSSTNTVCIRTNGLTNNRTLPLSECGVTISTTAVNTAAAFTFAGASFSTGVGAGSYGIGSGSVTLPNDSLGKTYVFDVCVTCTTGGAITSTVQLRVGAVTIGTNDLTGIVLDNTDLVNINIRSFYTSIANSEAVTLFNNSGQTLTPTLGKLLIREVPRTVV